MQNPPNSQPPRPERSRVRKAPETTPAKAKVAKRKKPAPAQDKLAGPGTVLQGRRHLVALLRQGDSAPFAAGCPAGWT